MNCLFCVYLPGDDWTLLSHKVIKVWPEGLLLCSFFQVSKDTEKWHQVFWKNSSHFVKNCCTAKIQITSPSLHFSKYWWKLKIVVGHFEKMEKWLFFMENHRTTKFQISDPPQSLGFHSHFTENFECWIWTKVFSLPHKSPMWNFTLPHV